METKGAVVSTFRPVTVAVAVLPALSSAGAVMVWFAPSLESGMSAGQVGTPGRVSVRVVWYQPALLRLPTTVAVIVGGVLSMLMPDTVAVAVFPARSVATAVVDCPAPSPLSTVGSGQAAIPDRASPQV